MCVYLSANPRELNSLLKVVYAMLLRFYNIMTLKPMHDTISDAESSILEISRKHGMITISSLSGQLLRRWSMGNAICDVVFQPVRENCLQCCEKRKWMPWIVLLFLRRRSARKELLKLGMSCFSIPHLLKKSLWRNLMLWVCSQTPKKGISPKLLKNNVKGRTRRHKKRHWTLFRSASEVTYPKPQNNNVKGRTCHHKKRFYEGHITSFDQSEKKHTVNYDDGDQEKLNLTNEYWEFVEDGNTSNPIQESLPGSSDMFDMPLSCFIDSYRHTRKKKKALNVVDDVAVLTPGTESKKIVHSKAKLYRGKATDDPAPSTMTMQQSKVNKVE